MLSFYFRDEVLPYYAGDSAEARDLAANDFKYWELMRRACERGLRVFDYGRSKRGTGLVRLQEELGIRTRRRSRTSTGCLRRDAIPQNNPPNPKYRAFIALWRRLPMPLANRLGPMIVRELG